MAWEIERRFLVLSMDEKIDFGQGTEILQGYLEVPVPEKSIRVRIMDDERAVLTRKIGTGVKRPHKEPKIGLIAARILLEACRDYLEKTRYYRDGWSVDFFHPPLSGIVLIECEGQAVEKGVKLPPWVFEAIEVTESLSNIHLARLATDLRGNDGDENQALLAVYELISKKIVKIVLTGGPCSGKSGIMEVVRQQMPDRVNCVPEAATVVIKQVGVPPPQENLAASRRYNRTIRDVQRIFEATSAEYALSQGKQALVIDRGTVDNAAYMFGGLEEMEIVYPTTREFELAQYDLVICLDVAPEEVYNAKFQNNPARTETYQEALALGQSIKEVWQGHPNFHFISNQGGWDQKEKKALDLIRSFLDETKTAKMS